MDGEPVFDDLWQAQVLAIADTLVAAGAFEAAAWSQALGEELTISQTAGAPDTPQTYYEAALRALERLLDHSKAVPSQELLEREDAWRQAYLSTPHGSPVALADPLD